MLLAPIALGAAPAWAWSSLACLIAVLAILQGGLLLLVAPQPVRPWPLPAWAVVPLLGIAGLALWQLTASLPVHPLRIALADTLRPGASLLATPILHRAEALDAVVRLGSVLLLGWLVAQAWTGAPVRPALSALALAGTLVAGSALSSHALGVENVLWLQGPFHPTPTGPFVARGAFACYLTLTMLAGAALWLTREGDTPGTLLAFAWTLMAAGLVASQSRTAVIAALAAHLLLLALAARGHWLDRRQALVGSAGMLALAALALLAAGLDGRLADLPGDLAHRAVIWQAALAAIAEQPWTGHGLGSFPELYPLYRLPSATQPVISAHSGPLEWATELGLPAAGAWLALLLGFAVALLRAPARSAGVLAAVPALTVVALQGAVDPGPQIPAVALTAALLVGLGLSRTPSEINHRAPPETSP
ncbi:O-antigen ligase family protein [Rhodovibrio salinarum]|uniref:O-antigen ligase family protein n=1 Tax=Rhodovibrio salinarum TaxID=1087 RepID=UPI001908FA20